MTGVMAAFASSSSSSGSSNYTVVNGTDIYNLTYGYNSGAYGSISPSGSSPYSGATIDVLYTSTFNTSTYLVISGNQSGGWTTMTIDSTPLLYSSATRSYDSGTNQTTWLWSGTTPLGTTANTSHTVSFS